MKKDPIKTLIEKHIKFRQSFTKIPAGFMHLYEKNGKKHTYLSMEFQIDAHLEKTVDKIRVIAIAENLKKEDNG